MKISQIIDELNIGLISHQINRSLKLIIVDQLLTCAINILTNFTIVSNRNYSMLALFFSFNMVFILFWFEMACFHLWQLAIGMLIFNMGV